MYNRNGCFLMQVFGGCAHSRTHALVYGSERSGHTSHTSVIHSRVVYVSESVHHQLSHALHTCH